MHSSVHNKKASVMSRVKWISDRLLHRRVPSPALDYCCKLGHQQDQSTADTVLDGASLSLSFPRTPLTITESGNHGIVNCGRLISGARCHLSSTCNYQLCCTTSTTTDFAYCSRCCCWCWYLIVCLCVQLSFPIRNVCVPASLCQW